MTEQPETDEQRADRLETERHHAAGDHQYCGVTCEAEMPSDMLRNFILAKGYPGTAGALDELLRRAAERPCGSRSLPTYSGDVVRCVLVAGHAGQCQSAAEYPYVLWPNPSNGAWNPEPAPVAQPSSDSLRELYAAAINAMVDGTEGCANGHRLADAVLSVRDREMERMQLLVAASSEPGNAVRMAAQYADRAIENGKRAEQAEADFVRVQQVACTRAENLRNAKGRLAELEAVIARVRQMAE
ncbi:hypothetical protein [Streptomyces sp. NPDC056192]|uniref:hypothetical protein n=1 Tax=Streptomyces sp. NPDC056192 TaxID=3345743 RepID=UPI0035D9CD67